MIFLGRKERVMIKELADRIAVTPMAITHYESGARRRDVYFHAHI